MSCGFLSLLLLRLVQAVLLISSLSKRLAPTEVVDDPIPLYQCMFDETTGSCFVEFGARVCSCRFGHFDLLEVLLDSGQFSKNRMLLCIDTVESKIRYCLLAYEPH